MSRPMKHKNAGGRRGPQLPVAMQEKLGLPQRNKRPRTQIAERKQQRQEARRENHGYASKRRKIEHDSSEEESESEAGDMSEVKYAAGTGNMKELSKDIFTGDKKNGNGMNTRHSKPVLAIESDEDEETLSSSEASHNISEDDSDSLSRGSREYSPEIVLDATSRTFKDKQAEEDAEILALERKLGAKRDKHNVDDNDDFDDLLGGLEKKPRSRGQTQEDKAWLERKRQRDQPLTDTAKHNSREIEDDDVSQDEHDSGDFDEFEGFDSENKDDDAGRTDTEPLPSPKPARENPYIAPQQGTNGTSIAKYIPPARRKPLDTDHENLERLRKQAQGLLNRLSEANMISILEEFEKLYQNNSRQDVTTVLIDLLIASFSNPSSLQNTFIILHAAFIAALYKVLGADFGAEIVSRLVETFDQYQNSTTTQSKEQLNLISLLANLFTFGVISSSLVYDQIRLLLSDFGENSAELLLRVVRDCGPQLRSDDPTALKGIVQMMNDISAQMTSSGQTTNVRTRVMMDTITDLKNNKTKQATNAAGQTGEHLTRMRKALGSLNNRQLRATEPLGITRSDILNSDKKGKWWLVGASWKGDVSTERAGKSTQKRDSMVTFPSDDDFHADSIDFAALARHYKLTTPTHRSIFTAILSATDGTDALQRISKLRLTRKQEPEIPRVMLRICRAEPTFNDYYTVIARLLLRDGKRYRFPFEIALWKFFEEIGEGTLDDEEGSDAEDYNQGEVQIHEIANVARLYASLVARKVLTLDVLKTLNIGFLKESAQLWLEMFFVHMLGDPKLEESALLEIFSQVRPDMAKSVGFFLKKQVRKSDLVPKGRDRSKVKTHVRMAEAALVAISREYNIAS